MVSTLPNLKFWPLEKCKNQKDNLLLLLSVTEDPVWTNHKAQLLCQDHIATHTWAAVGQENRILHYHKLDCFIQI